jgi:hypothetical protein
MHQKAGTRGFDYQGSDDQRGLCGATYEECCQQSAIGPPFWRLKDVPAATPTEQHAGPGKNP